MDSSDRSVSARVGLGGVCRQTLRGAGILAITAGGLVVLPWRGWLGSPARRATVRARFRRSQVGLVLRLLGVQLHVESPSPPPAAGGRLVVSNHRSALDIVVMLWLFDGWFVSRGDLADWPLMGAAASQAGILFVDREHAGSRLTALGTVQRMLEQGDTVVIFPEGTTFPGDDVEPFSPGCFAAAIASGAEVLPVGLACEPEVEYLDESFARHYARVAARPRTHLAARIGTPRTPAPGTDPVSLASKMRNAVQELVRQARRDQETRPTG